MADIEGRYTPVNPTRGYVQNYRKAAGENFKLLAEWINRMPESRQKSVALTHLDLAFGMVDRCIVDGELEMKGGQVVVPPLEIVDPEETAEQAKAK